MAMPETAVNKDCQLPAKPYKVRFAREFFTVDAITGEAEFPAELADCEFWHSVFPPDVPHVIRAAFRGKLIHGYFLREATSSVACFGNFVMSHFKTSIWSPDVARRT